MALSLQKGRKRDGKMLYANKNPTYTQKKKAGECVRYTLFVQKSAAQ